jgi:hypothetical protein
MSEIIDKKYIPLDKSWVIRMGILDLINGYDDICIFLDKQKNLGDDLLALQRASKIWKSNDPVDVGESGTLYRLLKFVSWKQKLNKKFVIKRTLKERKITDNPDIVERPLNKLLKLDNNTSQWATASVLLGNKEKISNPPYKLELTYKAVSHWRKQRKLNKNWEAKHDDTISTQAKTFLNILSGKKAKFIPKQAEDFCFAYTFGYISTKDGEKKWPSLRGHESDRIVEMEESLQLAKQGKEITSKDHRVVQALGMWGTLNNRKLKIKYPKSVNKSWPQFWDFIKSI